MKRFTLLLWCIVGAIINLALYKKGVFYTWHYLLGVVVGLVGATISNHKNY